MVFRHLLYLLPHLMFHSYPLVAQSFRTGAERNLAGSRINSGRPVLLARSTNLLRFRAHS